MTQQECAWRPVRRTWEGATSWAGPGERGAETGGGSRVGGAGSEGAGAVARTVPSPGRLTPVPRPGGGSTGPLLVMDCVMPWPCVGGAAAAAPCDWSRDDDTLSLPLSRRRPHILRGGPRAPVLRAGPHAPPAPHLAGGVPEPGPGGPRRGFSRGALRTVRRHPSGGRRGPRRCSARRPVARPGPRGRRRPPAGGRRPAHHAAGELARVLPGHGRRAARGRSRPLRGGPRPPGGPPDRAAAGLRQRRRGGPRRGRGPVPGRRRPARAAAVQHLR